VAYHYDQAVIIKMQTSVSSDYIHTKECVDYAA